MSLKIWLPFTENKNNQGVVNLYPSSEQLAQGTTGKIGKCYGGGVIYNTSQSIIGNKWTIAMWVKTSSWGTYNDILACKNIDSSGHCQFYFSVIGGNTLNIGVNTGSSSLTYSYTFATDTWYHLATTYDGTTCVLYINGNSVKEGNVTNSAYTDCPNIGIGCRSSNTTGTSMTGQSATRFYNDVRIYDNVLTPREINNISQCLILHYSLSNFGMPNLLQKPISDNGWTRWYDNATTWNSNNISEKIIDTNGKIWVHVKQTTASGYGGVSCDPSNNGIIIDPTKKYTISALAKAGTSTYARLVFWNHWRSTEGGANLYQNQTLCNLSSTPKRVYAVWTPNAGSSSYTPNRINLMIGTCYQSNMASHPDNEVYFTDVKFEEGEIATPYIPNVNETSYNTVGFGNNIEHDVSGYQYNGTKINTNLIQTSSNTKRHNSSTSFIRLSSSNSTSNVGYIKLSNFYMPDEFTISYWWYYDSSLKVIGNPPSCFGYGTFTGHNTDGVHNYDDKIIMNFADFGSDTKSVQKYFSITYSDKNWCHICVVFNGNTMYLYKNGQLQSSLTVNSSTKMHIVRSNRDLIIGADQAGGLARGASGNISDFRIYATALSADEVKYLYDGGDAS